MNKPWQTKYRAADQTIWSGRDDGAQAERFFQRVQCCDLSQQFPTEPGVALLGFACDAGVKRNLGRPGAAQGPKALRAQLASMAAHFDANINLYDVGDIVCDDQDLETAQQSLAAVVELLLNAGITPYLIGGGHEIAWGHYQGIAGAHPKADIGIINFDAHFDLRPTLAGNQGSSGTPFLQIAEHRQQQKLDFSYLCLGVQPLANTASLYATAKQLGVQHVSAAQIDEASTDKTLSDFLAKHEAIYLTICLDAFAASIAPGVSAPQALGLLPQQVLPHLARIAQTGKVISCDIAELSPAHDKEHQTSKLAASLLAGVLSLIA